MSELDTNTCAACDCDLSDSHGYVFKVHGLTFTLCDCCARKYNTDETFRVLAEMRAIVLHDIDEVYGKKCDRLYEDIKRVNERLADQSVPEYYREQDKALNVQLWSSFNKYNAIRQELIKVAGGEVANTLYDDIEEEEEEDE